VGPERIKGAYVWRTALNSGIRLALGSDFPVEFVNPFFGIYAAFTRRGSSPISRSSMAISTRSKGIQSEGALQPQRHRNHGDVCVCSVLNTSIFQRGVSFIFQMIAWNRGSSRTKSNSRLTLMYGMAPSLREKDSCRLATVRSRSPRNA